MYFIHPAGVPAPFEFTVDKCQRYLFGGNRIDKARTDIEYICIISA